MKFSDFKTALRNYEESEMSCNSTDSKDSVMYAAKSKFDVSNAKRKVIKVPNVG